MKVVFIITKSDRAGAQMHVLSLMQGLRDEYDFFLIVGDEGFLTEQSRELGVEYHVVSSINRNISLFSDIRSVLKVRNILKAISPDLVHVHSAKASLVGRLAAKLLKIKTVYTVHGWAFSEGNPFLKKIISLVVEKVMSVFTDKFIVVSNYDKKISVGRVIRQENVVTIHNGISDKVVRNRNSGDNSIYRIVCVARLSKQKNLACLLHALTHIKCDIQLDLYGDGPERLDLEQMAVALGLQNRLTFHGEAENIEELLPRYDVFILSSDWEGLPIALIEASRASLPIVATDVGGVGEVVENGVNGFLVPRNDSRQLAQKLLKLLRDVELRREFSRASRKKFENEFRLKPMIQKTNSVYTELGVRVP